MQFLDARLHGLLDYVAAAALIAAPFILGLEAHGPVAMWLSVGGGAGLILYSLLTDYGLGVVPVIPFRLHLLLDLGAAVAFIAAIFIFSFTGLAAIYYAVMAGGVILVVLASKR